ncbi:unnamed protein product [Tetraodon nigroviridis]|uniref:(spotted green pufferfish) hypothetical protein n=1 Tax=Tetraodon nigroviridis TaxID=99883 RepID=Q4S6B2_TETNG|nr:unnamed protein product [Tetraodon nigroviridis]
MRLGKVKVLDLGPRQTTPKVKGQRWSSEPSQRLWDWLDQRRFGHHKHDLAVFSRPPTLAVLLTGFRLHGDERVRPRSARSSPHVLPRSELLIDTFSLPPSGQRLRCPFTGRLG